jgi:hypothetical protein
LNCRALRYMHIEKLAATVGPESPKAARHTEPS